VSIVIDKKKLVQVLADALRDIIPKISVKITTRTVRTDESGVYSESLGNQISCMSTDPSIICVQSTDGANYYVRTYYAQTDIDENAIQDNTIVHTHRLKIAPNADVIIVEVTAGEQSE
jgi:hypothetical protein